MLCRVFYKSKTESNIELSQQNVYDAEARAGGDTSPNAAHIMLPSCNIYHNQTISSESPAPHDHQNPSNHNTVSPLNPNLVLLSHHQFHSDHLNEMIMINSKYEIDDYGFLMDTSFEDMNSGDGTSNMEMKFEDNHSSIFLQ